MVIEYIKRGQRLGYDGDTLVYKIPESEASPLVTSDEQSELFADEE